MISKKFFCAILLATLSGTFIAANAQDEPEPQPNVARLASVTILPKPESVLGKRLVGASGENAGRIVDVLADETGNVRAAVVDYGGFLGIGVRRIAVAWSDLRFGSKADAVAVDLSSERLARAPEVRAGMPVIAVTAHRAPWHRAARN